MEAVYPFEMLANSTDIDGVMPQTVVLMWGVMWGSSACTTAAAPLSALQRQMSAGSALFATQIASRSEPSRAVREA